MKKFQFRLNAFLSYRKHLEQEAKQAVALTRVKIDECRQRIAIQQEQQAKNLQELQEKMSSGISAAQISVYISYHQRLERGLYDESQLLINLQKELAHKQKLLKQRSIEKKAIENLKQRSKEEYYKEIDMILQKETEDMVIMRKIRENMK